MSGEKTQTLEEVVERRLRAWSGPLLIHCAEKVPSDNCIGREWRALAIAPDGRSPRTLSILMICETFSESRNATVRSWLSDGRAPRSRGRPILTTAIGRTTRAPKGSSYARTSGARSSTTLVIATAEFHG